MGLILPAGVVELRPPDTLVIADNVPPACAIDSRGEVFYLHFASRVGVPGSTVMRVVCYPPGSRDGEEVAIPLNPNASAIFIEYRGTLYVLGHHNEYPNGKKKTRIVSVPVREAVCPCTIF